MVTQEQIAWVNKRDILQVAHERGYEPKFHSGAEYRIEGHGGLYINVEKNSWHSFSGNSVGGGVIQLVMHMEGKSWIESVVALLGKEAERAEIRMHIAEKRERERKEFELPERAENDKRVIGYLVKQRGIDVGTVMRFIHRKDLYQDVHGNCVFLGRDPETEIKYGNLRGTHTEKAFKGEVPGSDKRYSFSVSGRGDRLVVCESAIEVLSLISYRKIQKGTAHDNNHYLSLGGASDIALEQYLSDHPEINTIVLALNNDRQGKESTEYILQKYASKYDLQTFFPNEKDWNDELKKLGIDREREKEEEQEDGEWNQEEEWER